jgi:hypothetical protein
MLPISKTPHAHGLAITGLIIHLSLSDKKQGNLDRGCHPYDYYNEGWNSLKAAMRNLGAYDIERGYHGGIDFKVPDIETGRSVVRATNALLSRKLCPPS